MLTWALLTLIVSVAYGKPPNIVFIVADDLGWNDVSWHNPEIITPNLQKLASEGVTLDQSYVQPMCTPSRSSFMTGYYPFHSGLQHYVIRAVEPTGLPLHFTTLPEKLQDLGYKCHLVGKWHLGYCSWDYTPMHRGFQSHVGYYNGEEDYYTHITNDNGSGRLYTGYDFRVNESVGYKYNGTYSTFTYAKETERIISNHDPSQPLFLYLGFQAVHAPLEVPEKYSDLYKKIKNIPRRTFSGMVTAMDEAVGRVVDALKNYNLYNDTLIVFTTDNGGQTLFGGNNWPLRGNKMTLWEGGTRGIAFAHGPMLKKTGYTNTRMMHAVDWFPTLLHVAGSKADAGIDGVNQWASISKNAPSSRKEFVYNLDNYTAFSGAIRIGDYKLIVGKAGEPSGWIPPPQVTNLYDNKTNQSMLEMNENSETMLLFNLHKDPTEHTNLASTMPEKVSKLWLRLQEHLKTLVPAINKPDDPAGDPKLWGGVYTPGWCKPIK